MDGFIMAGAGHADVLAQQDPVLPAIHVSARRKDDARVSDKFMRCAQPRLRAAHDGCSKSESKKKAPAKFCGWIEAGSWQPRQKLAFISTS
jgi:hypothetical protein